MPAFTVFPDQSLRGGLRASLGLAPQPGGESEERCTLLRPGRPPPHLRECAYLASGNDCCSRRVASGAGTTSSSSCRTLIVATAPPAVAINSVSSHGDARTDRLGKARWRGESCDWGRIRFTSGNFRAGVWRACGERVPMGPIRLSCPPIPRYAKETRHEQTVDRDRRARGRWIHRIVPGSGCSQPRRHRRRRRAKTSRRR